MALQRLILRRELSGHPVRIGLAMVTVACGTAGIVAAVLLYDALVRSYQNTVEVAVQGADLQIVNGELGVPEDLVESVRSVPGVATASAVVHGPILLRRPQRERVYVHGVDVVSDAATNAIGRSEVIVPDALLFVSDPDSVAVTRAGAERRGWRLGRRLQVQAAAGAAELTIRAVFDPAHWAARALGDRLLVMDLPAAQRLLAMGDRVSHIDVRISPDEGLEAVAARLKTLVAGRAHVSRPGASGDTLRGLLAGYRYGLGIGASLALLVALYVIVNAMVISVAQKHRDLVVLTLLGLTRRQLYRLVAAEALGLGLAGGSVGVLLGWLLARILAPAGGRGVSALYMHVDDPVVRFDLGVAMLGLGGALLIVVLAGFMACRATVRRSLLDTGWPAATNGGWRWRVRWLVLVGIGSMAWIVWDVLGVSSSALHPSLAVRGVVAALVVMAVVGSLAAPAVIARCDRYIVHSCGPVTLLIRRTLSAELGRVMLMSLALLVGLAGVLGLAALMGSLEGALATGLRATLAHVDLVVTAGGGRFSEQTIPIAADVLAAIRRVPGVAYVDPVTSVQIVYQGSLTALVASDATLLADGRRDLPIVAPDRDRAVAGLAMGEGVLVTNTFARRFGRDIGDTITFASPSGRVMLPILGRYLFEPSAGDVGAIRIDQRRYRRLFDNEAVTAVHVTLRSQADASRVVRRMQRQIGDRNALVVATVSALRQQYHAVLDGLGSLLTPMVAVAGLLGSLGLMAGRFATVEGRRRLLDVLRTIGATRRQRVSLIVGESVVLGAIVAVLAVVLGSALGYLEVRLLLRDACGIDVPYLHPTGFGAGVALAATALGAGSGWMHERLIARLPYARGLTHG